MDNIIKTICIVALCTSAKEFGISTIIVDKYKMETAADAENSKFPHLLWHSDADGDYVPRNHKPTIDRGSSIELAKELAVIKPKIDGLEDDEIILLKSDKTDGKHLKRIWQELYDATQESIKTGKAMILC